MNGRRSSRERSLHPLGSHVPIEVHDDRLTFGLDLSISFMRTLRVSETGLNALPPGLGRFPLRSVASLGQHASVNMSRRDGVALPIYQCEAMWMSFDAEVPVAVQIGAGMRCAITGGTFLDILSRRPQNYVNADDQPWLDGFKTASGEVRQFVAAPLGAGATVEEQLSDAPAAGGIQIQVWELTPEALKRWKNAQGYGQSAPDCFPMLGTVSEMGLGAGGRIRQEIYRDTFKASDWRAQPSARAWVHLVSARDWTELTGEPRPSTPVDTDAYIRAGLPWSHYYAADRLDVETSPVLAGVKSVGAILEQETVKPSSLSVSIGNTRVIHYGDPRPEVVGAGDWS